jgi:hypothetical protein
MATIKQIAANRANAQKSTGPRTPEGKSVSRSNACKTGIYAALESTPYEQASDLETLTAEFYAQFPPATAEERTLVDLVIRNEWLRRRSARGEAHYWNQKRVRHFDGPVALDDRDVVGRDYTRLQWRLNSLQHNLFTALDRLRDLHQSPRQSTDPEALNPELGSFCSSTGEPAESDPAPDRPAAAESSLIPDTPGRPVQ